MNLWRTWLVTFEMDNILVNLPRLVKYPMKQLRCIVDGFPTSQFKLFLAIICIFRARFCFTVVVIKTPRPISLYLFFSFGYCWLSLSLSLSLSVSLSFSECGFVFALLALASRFLVKFDRKLWNASGWELSQLWRVSRAARLGCYANPRIGASCTQVNVTASRLWTVSPLESFPLQL